MNRLIISGTNSGCGKTSITCGILKILVARGLKVSTFKCGCDYIDGMYHSRITGTTPHNLDSCFCDESTLKYILGENSYSSDISIVEGVMGYYDGVGFTTKSSTYEISKITNTPVILIVDCHGMGTSIGAIINGYITYYKDNLIKGVIFNRISPTLYEEASRYAESMGIIPVGYVPKLSSDILLESRHLGLLTVNEVSEFDNKVSALSEILSKTIDIDRLLEVSHSKPMDYSRVEHMDYNRIKIAVSRDVAFSFMYGDNIDFLKRSNCDIIYFSPMYDKQLPKDISGLILCGGYPELYTEKLSANVSMIKSIKTEIEKGIPYIAECGGYMYLQSGIVHANRIYPMVGIFKGICSMTKKLNRFGYVNLKPKSNKSLFNGTLICHEFHYSDSTDNGMDYTAIKLSNGKSWECVHGGYNYYAGYPHIYYYGNINQINLFLRKCLEYEKSR